MKKSFILLITLVLSLSFTGCSSGVSQKEYDKLKSQKESIEKKYSELQSDYNSIKDKYAEHTNPLESKIISIHEEFDNPKAVENIKSDIHKVSDGVVAVLKNNNSFPIDLKASIVYYDDKGKMISNSSDENFCFESGKKCVLFFYAPEDIECNKINYAKYEITYSAKVLQITGHVSDIQQESNFGADNVMLKLTNSGKNNMNMTNVGILFYNKGEIIGCKTSFVNITKLGSIDTLEFSLPDNRDTSKVDDYKIFINYAYNLEL